MSHLSFFFIQNAHLQLLIYPILYQSTGTKTQYMYNFSQFKYEQETESKHQRFLHCNTKTDRQTPYTEVKMGLLCRLWCYLLYHLAVAQ